MNSRFFNKETIEIYGHASTDVFNENNVYFLKCKYSVWTEFTKHLLYALHNYLHKVIQTNCEQCDYYEYKCIQELYEYNLTEYLADVNIYNYLNKNIDIFRTALIRYDLYGIYCFYDLLNNLDATKPMNKTISLGNMYDIHLLFEKIIEFISNEKSLECARTIQQIFKNYHSINKYTIISITYDKLTVDDAETNTVIII